MVKISSVFKTDEVKEEDRKQIREALHWKHSIVAQVTLKRPICIPQMEDPCECNAYDDDLEKSYYILCIAPYFYVCYLIF